MGFSFIVCSFILPFIQTCAECLYARWLVKTLPGLRMNQRHRCERLGEQNLWAAPPTCLRPWHLPSLSWCFWVEKRDKTKFKWSSLCVFVCLLKSLHLVILKRGLWLNPGNQKGKNHSLGLVDQKIPCGLTDHRFLHSPLHQRDDGLTFNGLCCFSWIFLPCA